MNYAVNLLPEELWPRPLVDKKRLGVIAAITVTGAVTVLWGGAWVFNFWHQRAELTAVSAQLAYLRPAVQRYDTEQAQEQGYLTETRTLEGLTSGQRFWKPVLDQIGAVLPVDAWLDSVDLTYSQPAASGQPSAQKTPGAAKPGTQGAPAGGVPPQPNVLVIKGRARSFSSVGVFEKNLSVALSGGTGSPGHPLLNKVTIDQITENSSGEWSFTLTCHLNPV